MIHTDSRSSSFRQVRQDHWDALARQPGPRSLFSACYHRRLHQIYRQLVPPGQRVLELGCADGSLLAALQPARGVGVDFSSAMLAHAPQDQPNLRFICADAHDLAANASLRQEDPFDVIILSDLLNDLWDVQTVLEGVALCCTPHTRILLNCYSQVWQLPLLLAGRLGLARPNLAQNWLQPEDIANLLHLSGLEQIRVWSEFLFPLPIPFLADWFNRFLVRFWPFFGFALSNFILARPAPGALALPPRPSESGPASGFRFGHPLRTSASDIRFGHPQGCRRGAVGKSGQRTADSGQRYRVSVIVPARNEAGNIRAIFERTPAMGAGTQLVLVEGHSNDGTWAEIERQAAAHPQQRSKILQQTGTGKGDAVRAGFASADGQILMILDADLTVPPEDLPRFYEALVSGKGEFINGVRLVYPMEKEAMRLLNLAGNKFFSVAFSWLLGQPVKDTLCGTKVLWKQDYERIAQNRSYFGEFDPFGDYDLLFGASRLNLRIVDLPIRYRERTYGTTNIQRWKHGWLLLRMLFFAARKIKFV